MQASIAACHKESLAARMGRSYEVPIIAADVVLQRSATMLRHSARPKWAPQRVRWNGQWTRCRSCIHTALLLMFGLLSRPFATC
jgi:hypothetical protein